MQSEFVEAALTAYVTANGILAYILDCDSRVQTGQEPGTGEVTVFAVVMLVFGIPLVMTSLAYQSLGSQTENREGA